MNNGGTYSEEYLEIRQLKKDVWLVRRATGTGEMFLAQKCRKTEEIIKLDHVNIVGYFRHFQEENIVITEFYDSDLKQKLTAIKANKGQFAQYELWSVLIQACLALAHAHSRYVMHGDLRPSSLKLKEILKVDGFGKPFE